MYNLQSQATQLNAFNTVRASKYLRFSIAEKHFSKNTLALIQLKKGHSLNLKNTLDAHGNDLLQLLYKNCVVATIPKLLASQIIRNQNKGVVYSVQIESVEKLLALCPNKLSLILKCD